MPALRRRGGAKEHLPELGAPLDDVVGGEHRHDRLGVERSESGHGEPDRGGVAARVRLDDHMVRRELG